ncbi:MAG: germination protein YpeB [Bacillota bacterium]
MNRTLIVVVTTIILVVVAASATMLRSQSARLNRTQSALQANYQRALHDLVKHTDNLQVHLSKALASSSSSQTLLLPTAAWNEADAVVENLAQLPLAELNLNRTFAFFSQVADYCFSLARKQTAGIAPTQADISQLAQLQRQVTALGQSFHELRDKFGRGNIPIQAVQAKGLASAASNAFLDGFSKIDERLQNEVPTLTYDGPFSDHVVNRKPKLIEGEPQISPEKALEVALAFAGIRREELLESSVDGRSGGNLPTYKVRLNSVSTGPLHVDVSKAGGRVVLALKPRIPASSQISIEEAIARAVQYAQQRGFNLMTPTGYIKEDHTVLVSMVDQVDGVLIYPDMVKVRVALDNGEIITCDCLNYIMNHFTRKLPQPTLAPEQVTAKLPDRLEAVRVQKALIPLPDTREVLTYEVRARSRHTGDAFLIYLNASSGQEEMILKLLESAEGTLTL